MADTPLQHIRREVPPWAPGNTTVCGRPTTDVAAILDIGQAQALVTKHGKQRAAFLLCMTCSTNVTSTFTDDPVQCTRDWAARLIDVRWGGTGDPVRNEQAEQQTQMLRSLAALVAVHPEEFAALLAARDVLAQRRNARAVR